MIDLRRVLVPTDFSKHSENALRYAAAFAERFGAELLVLHVVQDLALFVPDAIAVAPPVAPAVEVLVESAQQALDRLVAAPPLAGLKVRALVREGTPFWEIIQTAQEENADLIVLATHGHSGLVHVLLGSVTEKVVRKAPCPVLTVRHPEHEFVHP